MDRELALRALLMAVWRRKPQRTVMVHSDQGSQYCSRAFARVLKQFGMKDLTPKQA
jgi:putative transposase